MGTGNSGSGVGIKTSEKQLALWGWRECERGKMGEGAPGETTLPVYQGKDFRSGGRSRFCHSLFRLQCPLNCYLNSLSSSFRVCELGAIFMAAATAKWNLAVPPDIRGQGGPLGFLSVASSAVAEPRSIPEKERKVLPFADLSFVLHHFCSFFFFGQLCTVLCIHSEVVS